MVADWSGTSLADPAPFRIVLWLTPAAFLAAASAMLAAEPMRSESSSAGSSVSERSPLGVFVLLGVVVFLFTSGEGVMRAFFNVYLDTRLAATPAQIGLTMGLAQLLPAVASLAVPGLVARFGTARTLTAASLVAAAGLAILGAVPVLIVAGAAYMAAMSMVSVHGATRNLFSQEIVGAVWRTTTAAILTVGMGLGWAISAAAGGMLVGTVDFRGLFYLTSGLATIAAIVSWAYQRATEQRVALSEVSVLKNV
jgi:hypothetical protein